MFKILIVEDDLHINKLISFILRAEGYIVYSATSVDTGIKSYNNHAIDLIICDYVLGSNTGLELIDLVRLRNKDIPIMVITAWTDMQKVYNSFESGIDDYLMKPLDNQELIYRVKALLRRAKGNIADKLIYGDLELDYTKLKITMKDIEIVLPPKEFYILYKLMTNPEQIFSRQQILDEIWGYETSSTEKTVNVHVNRIRKRLKKLDVIEIVAVRGVGYKVIIHEKN